MSICTSFARFLRLDPPLTSLQELGAGPCGWESDFFFQFISLELGKDAEKKKSSEQHSTHCHRANDNNKKEKLGHFAILVSHRYEKEGGKQVNFVVLVIHALTSQRIRAPISDPNFKPSLFFLCFIFSISWCLKRRASSSVRRFDNAIEYLCINNVGKFEVFSARLRGPLIRRKHSCQEKGIFRGPSARGSIVSEIKAKLTDAAIVQGRRFPARHNSKRRTKQIE